MVRRIFKHVMETVSKLTTPVLKETKITTKNSTKTTKMDLYWRKSWNLIAFYEILNKIFGIIYFLSFLMSMRFKKPDNTTEIQ
jgi:hypothetical protein